MKKILKHKKTYKKTNEIASDTMYKKIIISVLVVLVSLFTFLAIYTKGFHPNYKYYDEYIGIQVDYLSGERIPVLEARDSEIIFYQIEESELVFLSEKFVYYKNETYPFYELVNDEKITLYSYENRSYVSVKDIRNVKVGD